MKPSTQPTVSLVCGFLCTGKTSFTLKFATDTNAVALCLEEVVVQIFGYGVDHAYLANRRVAVREVMWTQADLLVSRGVSVVLDFGFWSRAERDKARALAALHEAKVQMFHVTAEDEVIYRKLAERNKVVPTSSPFFLSETDVEALKGAVDLYGEDEEFEIVLTDG
jgi:predicted kinase